MLEASGHRITARVSLYRRGRSWEGMAGAERVYIKCMGLEHHVLETSVFQAWHPCQLYTRTTSSKA